MSLRREAFLLSLIVLLALGSLALFSAQDRRDPNDHDNYYADEILPALTDYADPEHSGGRSAVLAREFLERGSYPPLARVSLLATLGELGVSRAVFRGANLPFLLLLVLGTWLLGRQLGGARVGLLAALLVVGIPSMLNHSRKFAPPWHAAALTPLTWALLLLAARLKGRGAWGAAVAAGFLQGARAYTHPIVYPDIAVSSLAVLAWSGTRYWRAREPAALKSVLRVAAAGGLALLLSSHVLGWELLGSEPNYSFNKYQASRAHIVGGGIDAAALLSAAMLYLREWFTMHLLPTGFILALVGGLACLYRAARGPHNEGWELACVLTAALVIQAPLALLTVSRGTFTADWMVLEPTACVLAAWGVLGAVRRSAPWARLWAYSAGGHSVLVLLVPLLLGAVLPSPFENPDLWTDGPGRFLARSSSGRVWNTHIVPIKEAGALRKISRDLQMGADNEPARVVDLTLRSADLDDRCAPQMAANSNWVWGAPNGQDLAGRRWSPWPSVFEKSAPLAPAFANEGSLKTPNWRTTPAHGDPVLHWLSTSRAAVVLRLWVELDEITRKDWSACVVGSPSPEVLQSANSSLSPLLPDYRWSAPYLDLGNELVGMEDGRFRDPVYMSRAFLLTP